MTRGNCWRVIQWVLAVCLLGFLVGYARRYWSDIWALPVRFDWMWASQGAILVLLSNLVQITLFQYFLQGNGLRLGFLTAWRIFSLPQAGKYIPGKVTALAALSYMLKGAGLSLQHALAAALVFNIVALLSGLIVGLFLLPVWAQHASLLVIVLSIGTALLSVLALCTPWFWSLVNYGLARLKREPLREYPSGRAMTRLIMGWILYWFLIGGGVFAITLAFVEAPPKSFPLVLAAFSLSCFVSNLSLLTPAGLGIREVLLVGIISNGSALAFATVFAAASRLAMVLNDIVMIGGAWFLSSKLSGQKDLQAAPLRPDVSKDTGGHRPG